MLLLQRLPTTSWPTTRWVSINQAHQAVVRQADVVLVLPTHSLASTVKGNLVDPGSKILKIVEVGHGLAQVLRKRRNLDIRLLNQNDTRD